MVPTDPCNFCHAHPDFGLELPGWRTLDVQLNDHTETLTICSRCTGLLKLIAPALTTHPGAHP